MSYQLIITEKPSAAKKIAEALADGKPIQKKNAGVSYWEVTHKNYDIVVASAVGHLYTITETEKKGWTYPVFDVHWAPTFEVDKQAAHTKAFITTLQKLTKGATSFILATDYDIEGEVIGYNVLKFSCHNKEKAAKRMKFSTLTTEELRESYLHLQPSINWGLTHAGLTRHELDWYYGINLSRALSLAVKRAGSFKILSAGRVQGPALKIIVDREKKILAFKPEPFWTVELKAAVKEHGKQHPLIAWHKEDRIFDKKRADEILAKTKNKPAAVADVKKTEFTQLAPFPFDLTTLQTESYRVHGIQPKITLDIAQELYIAGLISYPRTSSQQLPVALNYQNLLSALTKNKLYKELAEKVLAFPQLKPNNGKKTDPAHPAVYPTGHSARLEGMRFKVYDLIVKRFLATFASPAIRQTNTIDIGVNGERFIANGTRTLEPGWHYFYAPYVTLEEEVLPVVAIGDPVLVKDILKHDEQTKPPKRYTAASIIKELEKKNLGTKATRATIVETLFTRGYVTGKTIEATKLGIKTVDTLIKYCPEILDEGLTRYFEEEMEEIQDRKKTPEQVLTKAKEILLKILDHFKKKEKEIGAALIEANREAQEIANTIGPCPDCPHGGTLMIKRGKYGLFVACSSYPECKKTFPLPSGVLVKGTEKICPVCGHPEIMVIRKKSRPRELCLNVSCPTKHEGVTQKEIEALLPGKITKTCPKCKHLLVLRKSVYGTFLGCSTFPKCRHIEKVGEVQRKKTKKE